VLFGRYFGRTFALAFVDVRVIEEMGEEHQVTEVHARRQRDVQLRHPARLRTAGFQVTVRRVVDETSNEHLHQLATGDEHGHSFGRPVAHGPERVVRVHHGMHAVIHHDEPPGGRCELVIREPAVHQNGDVMVPMQEKERLFPKHDKDGVDQLGQFGQHEQPRPETGYLVIFEVTGDAHRMV